MPKDEGKVHIIDFENHGITEEIFAYLSIDGKGKSGICAAMTYLGMTPLVGMTRRDMYKWEATAKNIRNEAVGKKISLIRFKAVEVIE